MAGLLVGGWFASAFIAKHADNLRLYISSQYNYQTGTKSLMKKLERRLREILAVLHEADRRMVENPHLIDWLRDLKDAAFDAEDVLDRFEYELLRRQAKGQRFYAPVATVVKRLAFRDADLNELGDVVKRFDQLVDEKDTFLRILEQAAECKQAEIMQLRVRTSVPTEPNLIGREAEKGRLIGMLLSANNESGFRKKVNIVPIVGIGGVGKTTLAQFIYNDDKVKSFFDITAWVCVSDNFDVKIIMRKIVESASIQRPSDFYQIQNEDVIQKTLIGGLKGRKFLIILDDIWNEDSSRWEMLNASFEFGEEGSWAVVTTRDPRIADMMRTVPTVALDGLSGEDFWIFFQKCAFGEGITFPSLRTLLIKDMPELQEWEDIGSYQVVYPYLTSLFIGNCPKFRSFGGPIVLPSSLKKLELNQYDVYPPKRLTDQSTLEITIQDIGSYQAVYPNLRREWFPVHSLSCLEELTMPMCVLGLFPTEWFQQLYSVRQLQLFGCHTVYSLHVGVRNFPSLEVLILLDCFNILSITNNDLPSSLKELHIKHQQPTYHPPCDVIQCSHVQTITVDGIKMQQTKSSYAIEDDSMVIV